MADDLYDTDFIGWTEQQAARLRAAAGARLNDLGLDWDRLAEEIESLGKSQAHAVFSQLRRIVEHLLKLEFSPALEPRRGWIETVYDARAEIEGLLESDPGLKSRIAGMVPGALALGTKQAARALAAYGEDAAVAEVRRVGGGRYTQEQIVGDWLPKRPDLPRPRGAA